MVGMKVIWIEKVRATISRADESQKYNEDMDT